MFESTVEHIRPEIVHEVFVMVPYNERIGYDGLSLHHHPAVIGCRLVEIIKDRLVIIRYRREDAFVRFDVIDHGEGIAEEELDKIWQRYYKAGSNRRFVAGSGIGLSIVSTILDMHGAQYGVSSKLNEGSDFYFRIKCVENEESR